MLHSFAIHRTDMRLEEADFCAATSTRIRLTAGDGRQGVWPADGEVDSFFWRLDADAAERFAETVNDLVAFGQLSGSEILECGVIGELPVKVSHENSPMIFCCRIPLSRLDVQPTIWRDQNSRIADNDASARSGTQSLRNCRVAMPSLERPLLHRRKQAPVLSADSLVSHSGRNDNMAVS
jgi:hypothetical protein